MYHISVYTLLPINNETKEALLGGDGYIADFKRKNVVKNVLNLF